MNNFNIKKVVLITSLIFAGLTLLYIYVFRTQLNNLIRIRKLETELSDIHFNLVENRLSVTNMMRANFREEDYVDKKQGLLIAAQEANTNAMAKIDSFDMEGLDNEELTTKLQEVLQKVSTLLEQQERKLNQIMDTNLMLKDIYNYSPQADLNISLGREEVVNRAANASIGLSKINDNLSNYAETNDQLNLARSLKEIISDLNRVPDLEGVLFESHLNSLSQKFNDLKIYAYNFEVSLIKEDVFTLMLTDQTNVMTDLERIVKDPYFSTFVKLPVNLRIL